MEDQVNQIMADILGLDANKIDDSTAMDNVDTWDSVNHINLCLALEQEFGITLDVTDIEEMITQWDLVRVVQDKVTG